MKKLSELREQIDAIDTQVVELLKARAELVLGVRETKEATQTNVYSPVREQEILDRVAQLGKGGSFPQQSLEKIFRSIISATRSLVGDLLVAYVGPEHSLANQAAALQFGEDVKYFPASTVKDIFRMVQRGEVTHGVVPVETAAGGVETSTYDALIDAEVNIVAEIELAGKLSLVAAEAGLDAIEVVYADMSSLARCQDWLKTNLPAAQLVVADNPVVAARLSAQQKGAAAVVSESAQDQSGLRMLATGIENQSGSVARFFVVGGDIPPASGRDKTSLLVAVQERPGALSNILLPFSEAGLTLTKIESRPMKDRAGEFAFFIDLVGHKSDSKVSAAIERLRGISTYLKLLGSYPMARKI